MLLRSVISHVESQNWTAILIDFLIVVVGVFIGIQVSNWNDAQRHARNYELALERYRMEIALNMDILDTVEKEANRGLAIVGEAMDAMEVCSDTPENRTVIESGVLQIMGTIGLRLRRNALYELTENQTFLAQHSEQARQELQETRYVMDLFLREAEFIETLPLEERAQNNPLIKIGRIAERETVYKGIDYSRPERTLELDAPFDEICKNDRLMKSLYTWHRWQSAIPAVIRILRNRYEDELARMEAP